MLTNRSRRASTDHLVNATGRGTADLRALVAATILVLALIVALRFAAQTPTPPTPQEAKTNVARPQPATNTEADVPRPTPHWFVTAYRAEGGGAIDLFMELYEGPEPQDWIATSRGEEDGGIPARVAIPRVPKHRFLVRVDSRTGAVGPYSIVFHSAGHRPRPVAPAGDPDSFEPDDSWFQATRLALDEPQGHALSATANPRGDEDWFVFVTP